MLGVTQTSHPKSVADRGRDRVNPLLDLRFPEAMQVKISLTNQVIYDGVSELAKKGWL